MLQHDRILEFSRSIDTAPILTIKLATIIDLITSNQNLICREWYMISQSWRFAWWTEIVFRYFVEEKCRQISFWQFLKSFCSEREIIFFQLTDFRVNFVNWFESYSPSRRRRFTSLEKFWVNFSIDLADIQKVYVFRLLSEAKAAYCKTNCVFFIFDMSCMTRQVKKSSNDASNARSIWCNSSFRFVNWKKKIDSSK